MRTIIPQVNERTRRAHLPHAGHEDLAWRVADVERRRSLDFDRRKAGTELGDHPPEWADVRPGRGLVLGTILGLAIWAAIAFVVLIVISSA